MAHIEKINTQYKAIIEVGVTGSRKRRSKIFKLKKDAENWIATMLNEQLDGSYVNPSEMTLSQYMEKFLKNKKHQIAATTFDGYNNRFQAYIKPEIGYIPLQELDPFHLEEFFNNLRSNGKINSKGGLSENTLKKIYVLLNQALKKAIKMKILKFNPLEAIDSPQPERKEAKPMNMNHFKKLIDTAKEDDPFMYRYICFQVFTGLRRSEVLGLEWSEIDLNKRTARIKKTLVPVTGEGSKHRKKTKNKSSNRTIKLSKKATKILKLHKKRQAEIRLFLSDEYNDSKNYVFCKPDGTNYYPGTINKKLNRLLKSADLPLEYGTHTLRHTFATVGLKNGIEPKIIQEILGHTSISTTLDIYSHVDVEMQEKATDAIDKSIEI